MQHAAVPRRFHGGSTCGVQLATDGDSTRSSDRDDSLPSDRWPGRTKLRAIRWSIRSRLAEHPRLYLPIARAKVPDAVLRDDTELLIEGFTRSAVTFATIAFQLAQQRPVRVAHTLHSVGHVRMAVRRGVPSLVTIREPEETVLSAVVREPYLTLGGVLAAYTHFYTGIQPVRDRIVVGRFDSIVQDLGSVIRAINERFGTSFDEFVHTEENVRRCYEIIEDRARRVPWEKTLGRFQAGMITSDDYRAAAQRGHRAGEGRDAAVPETRVQRPSAARQEMKDALRARLEDPRLAVRRAAALAAYQRFASGAV
jgi:hypothetical protein